MIEAMNGPVNFGGAICDGIECLPIYAAGYGPIFLGASLAVLIVFMLFWRLTKKTWTPPIKIYALLPLIMTVLVFISLGLVIISDKRSEQSRIAKSEQAINFDLYELAGVRRSRSFLSNPGETSSDVEVTLIHDEGKISYMVQGENSIFLRKFDEGSCFIFPLAVSNTEVNCEPEVIDGIPVYITKRDDNGVVGYYLVKGNTAIALKGERLTSEELRQALRSLQEVSVKNLNLSL